MNSPEVETFYHLLALIVPSVATVISAYVTYNLKIGLLELELRIKGDFQESISQCARREDLTEVEQRIAHLERRRGNS